jgi:AcrR family transcriptional regulator
MEPRDLRRDILAAARGLFLRQGYHGLSMRQIAEAVGVSKAALYYHFQDKEELFLAILNDALETAEGLIDGVQAQGGSARERIRLLVQSLLSQPKGQYALILLAAQDLPELSPAGRRSFDQAYQARFLRKVQAILEEGMQSGELRRIDPAVAAWILLGMIYPFSHPAQTIETPPTSARIEQLVTVYLDGLAAG